MIADKLQKLLNAYFTFSIVAKFRDILNNSYYVTKRLEASLTFSVGAKFRDLISKTHQEFYAGRDPVNVRLRGRWE